MVFFIDLFLLYPFSMFSLYIVSHMCVCHILLGTAAAAALEFTGIIVKTLKISFTSNDKHKMCTHGSETA